MSFIAYRIICTITGKAYIGITTRGIRQRWWCHLWSARNRGGASALAAAIRKRGPDCFVIEEIACARDFASLKELERILIAQEGTVAPSGYNLTTGGDGTQGYARSEEQRRAHGERMKGRTCPPERREYLSQIFKGRQFSPEWCAKISAAKKGQGPSPEQAAAHSLKMKGKKYPPRSPEHREKLAANAVAQWARLRAANPDAARLAKSHTAEPAK